MLRQRPLDEAVDLAAHRHVGLHRLDPPRHRAALVGDRVRLGAVAGHADDHLSPGSRVAERDRAPDAPAAAGDDRHAAAQIDVHSVAQIDGH